MKIIILCIITNILIITTPLHGMNSLRKNKKTANELCYHGIQTRNSKKVSKAIRNGADVNHIFEPYAHCRENFLQMAIGTGYRLTIETLLNQPKIDVNQYAPGTLPPLHYAVRRGNLEIVQLLLNHPHIHIDVRDSHGGTCLMTALSNFTYYCQQIPRELLSRKIDTTIADQDGNTILHGACAKISFSWVNLILDTDNPPLNTQNKRGDTPLHIACRMNGHIIIKALLSSNHYIDLNLYNLEKKTPLDIALYSGFDAITSLFFDTHFQQSLRAHHSDKKVFDHAIRTGNKALLKSVLPSCYINSQSKSALTPLMIACKAGDAHIVELLLKEKTCNPLLKNRYKRTALHYASENGNLECVKKLYRYSGGLNQKDYFENTPLSLACSNEQIKVIDYLIKKGANTLKANKNGFIPLLILYQHKILDKIKKESLHRLLRAKNPDNNSLFHLLTQADSTPRDVYNYDNFLEFLLSNELDIYARNNHGFTPLDIITIKNYSRPIPSNMMQSFWRVTSDHQSYDALREILSVLPKDLRIFILALYYKLNIETIFAKACIQRPDFLSPYESQRQKFKQFLYDDLYFFPLLYRSAQPSLE